MRYRFFDFTLDSDVLLPELEPDSSGYPVLILREGGALSGLSADECVQDPGENDARPWPRVVRLDDGYVLAFGDRLSLRYSSGRVDWARAGTLSPDTFRHALLDQALPLIAAHEGRVVVHAACAIQNRRAVLFAGPAGQGKSTLVASLLAHGWQCAADDAVALRVQGERVLVRPSYGGLRLWPDSADALGYAGGDASALSSGKRRFGSLPISEGELALHAIYALASADPDRIPVVQELSPRESLMALVRNSYVLDPADGGRAAAQFETLAAVVRRIGVRSLVVPHRFEVLDEIRARIERDVQVTA